MQQLSKSLRESPVDYRGPLTGRCTVLLTVGDMYATDDLGLILLLWRYCSELIACRVAYLLEGNSSAFWLRL